MNSNIEDRRQTVIFKSSNSAQQNTSLSPVRFGPCYHANVLVHRDTKMNLIKADNQESCLNFLENFYKVRNKEISNFPNHYQREFFKRPRSTKVPHPSMKPTLYSLVTSDVDGSEL